MSRGDSKLNSIAWIPVHMLLIAAAAMSLAPFAWLICATLKRGDDLFNTMFLPWRHLDHLSLGAYARLFQQSPFARWMINSIFIASTQTVICVTLSCLGGFALAKYEFRGRWLITALMFGTMMLPYQVLLPSSYELMHKLGWVNSYLAILVPNAVNVFGLFLFRQAMAAVPDELLQAGRIDGCSELFIWWEITLPLIRPMIGAFTLMSFTGAWNSFLWPQIILQDEGKYTLPLGLANMVGQPGFQNDYSVLMAATLLSVLPVATLFFVLQRDFIAGLTSGAVKG